MTMFVNEKIRSKLSTARGILEKVYVDDISEKNIYQSLEVLKKPKASKRDKGVALFEIVNRVSPKFINSIVARVVNYKTDLLPFPKNIFRFRGKIGNGGMNDVFLLESKDTGTPSWVIKVPHVISEGNNFQHALKENSEYVEISGIFDKVSGLTLPEQSMIIQGPRGGHPVPVIVQKYLGTNFRDIFIGISREKLMQLMANDKLFTESISVFVQIFDTHNDLYEKQLDILGENNLSVVMTLDGPRLLLLDPHYRSSARIEKDKQKDIESRIDYLRSVVDSISKLRDLDSDQDIDLQRVESYH